MPKVIKRKVQLHPSQTLRIVFFKSVQVTLEGVGVVPALFTITILFVSPRRINEFMRSLMTTMLVGGSRYTDAPFEGAKSFITRTRVEINTVAPRTSRL